MRRAILMLALASCTLDEAENTHFSPDAKLRSDPEFMAAAHHWAERWSAATGLDVRITPSGGTPLRAVDVDWGTECARTRVKTVVGLSTSTLDVRIDITPPSNCSDIGLVLAHEFGHAMAPAGEHADHGLMAARPNELDVLDEAALTFVCSEQPCTNFVPEVQP